jgi:aryl-alcohol dehydrogenase-like predicted oxidoreductase
LAGDHELSIKKTWAPKVAPPVVGEGIRQDTSMKYRRLGRTNLNVSVIGIGTWQYGGEWGMEFTQADVDGIFDKAREFGVNLIDTAECYGNHTSEAFIGNAINRDRDKWIVATKFGHVFHGPFNRTDERSAGDARTQVEASLKALRTDRIDLLQYHSVGDTDFLDQDLKAELAKLVAEGKVRFVGNSIGAKAIGSAGASGQVPRSTEFNVSVLQVIYNRLDRRPEAGTPSVFDIAVEQDLGVLARVPLASGLLSGKYKPGTTFPEGDVRAKWKDPNLDAKLREVAAIAQTEVPAGVDMAAWALAWCLRHPAVTAVIPGCKSAKQMEQNASAAALIGD